MSKQNMVGVVKHETFCENLIKGQPFFEKLWDMEQGHKVN